MTQLFTQQLQFDCVSLLYSKSSDKVSNSDKDAGTSDCLISERSEGTRPKYVEDSESSQKIHSSLSSTEVKTTTRYMDT